MFGEGFYALPFSHHPPSTIPHSPFPLALSLRRIFDLEGEWGGRFPPQAADQGAGRRGRGNIGLECPPSRIPMESEIYLSWTGHFYFALATVNFSLFPASTADTLCGIKRSNLFRDDFHEKTGVFPFRLSLGCRVCILRTGRWQGARGRRSAGRVHNAHLPQPLAGRAHGGRAQGDGRRARRFRLRRHFRGEGGLEREFPALCRPQRLCPQKHWLPCSGALSGHGHGRGDLDETDAPHRAHPRHAAARWSHPPAQNLLHARRLALRVVPRPRDSLFQARVHRGLPLLPSRRGEPLRFLLPPRCRRPT